MTTSTYLILLEAPYVHIRAEKPKPEKEPDYIHRGLSTKNFERKITVDKYIEVTGVWLRDGILSIELEKVIPDHEKPKTFKPNSNPELIQG